MENEMENEESLPNQEPVFEIKETPFVPN